MTRRPAETRRAFRTAALTLAVAMILRDKVIARVKRATT